LSHAFRIEIQSTVHDTRPELFSKKIQHNGFPKARVMQVTDVYTVNKKFSNDEKRKIGQMLINPVIETASLDASHPPAHFDQVIELGFLPGVTDNLGHTVIESIEDLLKTAFKIPEENVYSSQLLFLEGVNEDAAQAIGKLFTNPLIHRVQVRSAVEFKAKGGMDLVIPKVDLHYEPKADTVSFDIEDEQLVEIGKKGIPNEDGTFRGPLAMRLSYLKTIQAYYRTHGRAPTDVEIEALAQTWSEHCKHTIFRDPLDEIKDGLFRHYIRRATEEIRKKKGDKDFCVSVFKDNSGGIIFDDDYVVTDKGETHNSPSALDPFGGAITGIVGVNRDTLGYGKGAKPVLNRYGFCFGDPDQNPELYRSPATERSRTQVSVAGGSCDLVGIVSEKSREARPTNRILSPRRILDGVVNGVRSGGNESGIPTPQGFLYFDERYTGKPLVFVGTVGLIPRTIDGEDTAKKEAQAGDRIIVAGGRVGLDGIHGATFSSEALDTGSPATAVQIGDPVTQKKLIDVIVREARDLNLYHSITDNGAGGISCSVSEMAKESGGCDVQLDRVPLKYPHLAPWQIWISESQERMTFAVPPENVEAFINLLRRRGVEATDIGTFNASGRCVVRYGDTVVMDLEMDFLHEGSPKEAQLSASHPIQNSEPKVDEPADMNATLLLMIAQKNIASFRFITHQFDHEVQGGSVVKPMQGAGLVNGTAAVLRPRIDSSRAIVTSQGLNPRYSDIDTYAMAAASLDDAVAAAVAVGGNVDYMAIMDNFCWCSSTEPERLGQLKAAVQACYDLAVAYGTPFISGKDSMFNDFKGFDANDKPTTLSIPPTLIVSALSVIPEASKAVTLDFKQPGDLIYLIGETHDEMGGSEYFAMHGVVGNSVPRVDPKVAYERYRRIFQATQKDLFNSMIHVDRGGLAVAFLKAAISGQIGAEIDLSKLKTAVERDDHILFSESKSRFLVSVAPSNQGAFEKQFPDAQHVGELRNDDRVVVHGRQQKSLAELSVSEVTQAYHGTFKDY
jgi:phosphoribosylformylglycinamidine synthase